MNRNKISRPQFPPPPPPALLQYIVGGVPTALELAISSSGLHGAHCRVAASSLLLVDRGSGIQIGKKLLQMPFLELHHVYIYYMTSHVQFCGKILPTAKVIGFTVFHGGLLVKHPII